MGKISEKGYVQLFYLLMKFKKNANIMEPSIDDIDFATNLAIIINHFKPETMKATFEYDKENLKIISPQINNYFNFIRVDYDGVINELMTKKENHYDEVTAIYYAEDMLISFDVLGNDLKALSELLFFNTQYNVEKFGDCKKALTKDKLHTHVDLELLKDTYKKFIKDMKNKKNNN